MSERSVAAIKHCCENCNLPARRTAYIPFAGGLIVCLVCCREWERLGEPKSEGELYRAIAERSRADKEKGEPI